MEEYSFQPIAHIRSDFTDKFGIPRQSGLIPELQATLEFTPPFRNTDLFRGLEEYSHIWLIWIFSENIRDSWSATVRPPRLGGNERRGVFATRAPYRPNPIGLSSVRLESIEYHSQLGPLLHVAGADLMDGTPILDVKPYIRYGDCHPEASLGFTSHNSDYLLDIDFPDDLLTQIPIEKQQALLEVLAQDPRPAYQNDVNRRYGLSFAGHNIRFVVENKTLRVFQVDKTEVSRRESGSE